jgi:hypothetical protein
MTTSTVHVSGSTDSKAWIRIGLAVASSFFLLGSSQPSQSQGQPPLFWDIPQYTAPGAISVAVGDFNRDGKLDVATATNSDSINILLGNGDGTFQNYVSYPKGQDSGSSSIVAADFNGDGKLDLAVANWFDNTISVFLGNGDGTFQKRVDYGTPGISPSSPLLVADFNNDGKPDLVVGTDEVLTVLLGNGDGTFRMSSFSVFPFRFGGMAVADFNHDGNMDLVVGDSVLMVLLGNGDGTFQSLLYVSDSFPSVSSLAVGDFNRDGKPDLVATAGNSVLVFLQSGDGSFQLGSYPYNQYVSYPTGGSACAVLVGDFNADGNADVITTNCNDNSVSVLLGNGDGTFRPHLDSPVGNGPTSLAAGDLNGDGKLDLIVTDTGDGAISLLVGSGDGTFQALPYSATGNGPAATSVADFNGDGVMDVAVANQADNSVSILLGKGDGTYQAHVDYATGKGPYSVVTGDFNGDGKQDLAVANNSDNSVSILLGKGDGTYQTHVDYATGKGPYSVITGDFNNDGKQDLAVANNTDNSVSILLGKGDGTFQAHVDYAAGKGPYSVVTGDFNGDGVPDLAVVGFAIDCLPPHYCSADGTIVILLGNGHGTFHAGATYTVADNLTYPAAAAVGDFNGDGKLDLVVANPGWDFVYISQWQSGSIAVLLGNGDGTLQPPVTYSCCGESPVDTVAPSSVAVGDVNGDGVQDLVVTDLITNWVGVLLGKGDGTFQPPTRYAGGQGHSAATLADLNSDGAPDVLFATPGNAVGVLFNLRGTFIDLQSSTNPSLPGQEVTFTTTIRASMKREGIGTPTAKVTFLDGTEALQSQALSATGEASFSMATLSPGQHSIRVLYSGDENFTSHTSAALIQQVNGPDFSLAAAPSSATLKAGSSVDFTLTSTAVYGFTGSVSLSCTVSPKQTLGPTCVVNPQSLSLASNGSATIKLTISTTPAVAFLDRMLQRKSSPLYALLFSVFSIAFLGTGCCRAGKKNMLEGMLWFLVLACMSLPLGCGGGSSSPPPPPPSPGTPPGNYEITVNAKSGSTSHSTAVSVTVQ